MRDKAKLRVSQQKAQRYAHQVLDQVSRLAPAELQEAAARALADAPDDGVRQAVLETSVLAPDEVTAAFVMAGVRSGGRRIARVAADLLMDIRQSKAALSIISECLESRDASVRQRGVEAIEVVSDPAAIGVLTSALGSDSAPVRRAAANSLGLMAGSKYHPLKSPLLEALGEASSPLARTIVESGDVQLQRELAQVLGYAESDLVLPVLSRLCQDEDVQVRREAVLSLASLNSDAAMEAIKGKLADPDHIVAACVLDAMAARYGRDSAQLLEAIQSALKHPSAEVRRHSVLMLDRYKLRQVEQMLVAAMGDADFEVQRSALELLHTLGAEPGAAWLGGGGADRSQAQQALMVWEAVNVSMDSGAAWAEKGAEVVKLLEGLVAEGAPSTRVHAISELLAISDIADSSLLRAALHDPDESVRSAASGGLASTRDAGLLAEVLQRHPDALVRRGAIETLLENPAGPRRAGAPTRRIEFTSARTIGMELMSYFLAALRDDDEGVRQTACAAVERYVEFGCPMPARTVVEGLMGLADDASSSSLVRDTAQELVEKIGDAAVATPLVKLARSALEWRGRLAREAHALRLDAGAGGYVLDPRGGLDPARIAEQWPGELGLSAEQAQAAAGALQSQKPLPNDLAQAIMAALVRDLVGCLDAVHHAGRALRLAGEARWRPELEQWTRAMEGAPRLDWGDDETVRSWCTMLPRLTRRAGISAAAAAESLKESPEACVLDEACADQDGWVQMAALVSRAEIEQDPSRSLARLAELCRSFGDDPDFLEVAGPALVALVAAGQGDFVPVLESALDRAPTDLRYELTQKLLVAAQKEPTADLLRSYLSGKPVARMGQLCLALALKGAGRELDGLDVPQSPPAEAGVELHAAVLGLAAMMGREEAVAQLESALRERQRRERYCSAVYLGLARVHSAMPIFSGVSDRDAPFPLRSLCAGMLVRGGQRQGMLWFSKMGTHAGQADKTRAAIDAGRAVADVIPLMLDCTNVNLGRFV